MSHFHGILLAWIYLECSFCVHLHCSCTAAMLEHHMKAMVLVSLHGHLSSLYGYFYNFWLFYIKKETVYCPKYFGSLSQAGSLSLAKAWFMKPKLFLEHR